MRARVCVYVYIYTHTPSFWWYPRKLGKNQATDCSFNLVKTETTLPKGAPKNQLSLLTKLVLWSWFHSTYSPA